MAGTVWLVAELDMDDVLYIVGSLCGFLAMLAVVGCFLVVLRKRGRQPDMAYDSPAWPPDYSTGVPPSPTNPERSATLAQNLESSDALSEEEK